MLILTRRSGEVLLIGEYVTVTVIEVKGRQVKLGINAPKGIAVHRQEIYQKLKEDDQQSNILFKKAIS
ncbi:carbon storage regulator CsrA [Legionella feeleii]|uniref:Translational regulator CsrA n=1 Tax=Legionella feeleii TaxID=453 RepID=A0A378IXS7_9GAMM|nr:carbon storage regulator CsrA [Legionella feeleii]STX39301.1 global regulator CsrA [Legionella feeleii]